MRDGKGYIIYCPLRRQFPLLCKEAAAFLLVFGNAVNLYNVL
jgi:hypothetical protein